SRGARSLRGCRLADRGGQCGLHQLALLGLMEARETRGGRGRRGAPRVVDRARLAREILQAMADLEPGALILRFLLAPDELARVAVSIQNRRVLLGREGIELLDAHDSHVLEFLE